MATRSLAEKLRILPGTRAAVFNAPKGIAALLDPLPAGATLPTTPRGTCGVVLGFVDSLPAAMALVPKLKATLTDGGVLWVCYPKLTSAKAGELSRDLLWKELGKLGLRAVAQVAIDETWSAIRFIPKG